MSYDFLLSFARRSLSLSFSQPSQVLSLPFSRSFPPHLISLSPAKGVPVCVRERGERRERRREERERHQKSDCCRCQEDLLSGGLHAHAHTLEGGGGRALHRNGGKCPPLSHPSLCFGRRPSVKLSSTLQNPYTFSPDVKFVFIIAIRPRGGHKGRMTTTIKALQSRPCVYVFGAYCVWGGKDRWGAPIGLLLL